MQHLSPEVRNSHFTCNPEPANGETEMPTTKVVDLPVHTKIGQVIASVHGGPIFSAVMCDTVALISLMTALVTFVELQVARNFVEAAGTDGFYIGSKRDEVQLIRSSTHPINPAMYRLIRFHGPSRILAISSPGKDKALNNIIYAALSRSSVLTQLSLAARFLSVMWICASH